MTTEFNQNPKSEPPRKRLNPFQRAILIGAAIIALGGIQSNVNPDRIKEDAKPLLHQRINGDPQCERAVRQLDIVDQGIWETIQKIPQNIQGILKFIANKCEPEPPQVEKINTPAPTTFKENPVESKYSIEEIETAIDKIQIDQIETQTNETGNFTATTILLPKSIRDKYPLSKAILGNRLRTKKQQNTLPLPDFAAMQIINFNAPKFGIGDGISQTYPPGPDINPYAVIPFYHTSPPYTEQNMDDALITLEDGTRRMGKRFSEEGGVFPLDKTYFCLDKNGKATMIPFNQINFDDYDHCFPMPWEFFKPGDASFTINKELVYVYAKGKYSSYEEYIRWLRENEDELDSGITAYMESNIFPFLIQTKDGKIQLAYVAPFLLQYPELLENIFEKYFGSNQIDIIASFDLGQDLANTGQYISFDTSDGKVYLKLDPTKPQTTDIGRIDFYVGP